MTDTTHPHPEPSEEASSLPVVAWFASGELYHTKDGIPFRHLPPAGEIHALVLLSDAQSQLNAMRVELGRKSDAIQKLRKERDEALAELAALKAAPVVDAWVPRTPADVRDFLGSHCSLLRWGDPSNPTVAVENDLYELTAHDVLSAFHWAGHYDKEIAATMAQTKETP